MGKKIRVGILLGGRSAEHEISLQSARNVIEAMDKEKYEILPIAVDKEGGWYLKQGLGFLADSDGYKAVPLKQEAERIGIIPGETSVHLISLAEHRLIGDIDVVFPVLHGPFGEDGTVQGLLKLAGIPFVGADLLGSAVGMDKDVMKRLLRDADIPIADFLAINRKNAGEVTFDDIKERLGSPVFVKPANLGSSVGISRVKDEKAYQEAVALALEFDEKVIVEEEIRGREIECAVLGNEDPAASLPGEILPKQEFYSYKAKYIDEEGALLEIPARLPDHVCKELQALAVHVFKILCCEGMGRVDFFLRDGHEIIVNEINTIPGFTKISMYPKLWEVSGVPYSELINRLIGLALARRQREKRLKTSVEG